MASPDEPLRAAVRGRVREDPEEIEPYRRDASHLAGRPRAVVAPADPEDVVALVRWARRNRVPLVPRGAGTSLDGESVSPEGGVVVDLSAWSAIAEVVPDELWARVGPGVVNWDLQEALRPVGLFYPPNPGSWTTSTIGGNLGTNASGPRSFGYGPTRAWVRSVEVVLGTGESVRLGTRVAKRSAGPDLLHLLVGSEGTLGIVTEATVRLAPRPAHRVGLVVPVAPDVSLGGLAGRLRRARGTGLTALEYLDRPSAAALRDAGKADWSDGSALVLLEIEGDSPRSIEERQRRTVDELRAGGAPSTPTVFDDADRLWTLRGESGVVLDERMGIRVREDVGVPLRQVDALVRRLEEIAREEDAPLYLFGHLGEGSLHPNYVVAPGSPKAERIRSALLTAALDLGGTISSEHGIGRVKSPFLARELGAPALGVLAAVKRACDPDGILNPGALYPPERSGASPGPSPSPSGSRGAASPPE